MALSSLLRTTESQQTVLLIFTPGTSDGRIAVDQLLEKAQSVLNASVQVMRISNATHPEVSRSFDFATSPTFVLVRRGQEVWRYAGPVDSSDLVRQLSNQIAQTFPIPFTSPSA